MIRSVLVSEFAQITAHYWKCRPRS